MSMYASMLSVARWCGLTRALSSSSIGLPRPSPSPGLGSPGLCLSTGSSQHLAYQMLPRLLLAFRHRSRPLPAFLCWPQPPLVRLRARIRTRILQPQRWIHLRIHSLSSRLALGLLVPGGRCARQRVSKTISAVLFFPVFVGRVCFSFSSFGVHGSDSSSDSNFYVSAYWIYYGEVKEPFNLFSALLSPFYFCATCAVFLYVSIAFLC